MSDAGNWCLIESDPGVFTQLISDMGVKDVQVEELWDIDDIVKFKPVYGLIFLFKYDPNITSAPTDEASSSDDMADEHIFFAKQVINNACATQAILSILMNRYEIDLGDKLREFREFAKELPPDMRGLVISNSDHIRQVHNSFARSEVFISEQQPASDEDADVYHFISYVPIHGALYELDGLRPGPINHGPCTDEDWLEKVKPILSARIARYSASEIRFNLMAVCRDRTAVLNESLELVNRKIDNAQRRLNGQPCDPDMEAHIPLQMSEVDLLLANLYNEQEVLQMQLLDEKEKHERYRRENARRKHNFIPLAYALLCGLARKRKLGELINHAGKKAADRVASERAARQKRKQ